jgi:GDP-mannose 6-dehydrogenase
MERVAVLGLGYVGCVTAACLTDLGHTVIGVDRDEYKVHRVMAGEPPFFEPGLAELIRAGRASGRLSATTDLREAMAGSDIALICVGTPSGRNGDVRLEQLTRVVEQIGAELARHPKPFLVAVRSTVFPGTCEKVVEPRLGAASVVSNPEFLREGSAVKDFFSQALLVVGGADPAAVRRIAELYAPLPVEPCLVDLRTAEMIKYACNAFHALKISFANEIGAIAESLGIDGAGVMSTFCRDQVLNISPAYLKPGFAFGGSCLPKDLRALVYQAGLLELRLPVLESIQDSNDEVIRRGIRAILELDSRRIGIFGLTFKENTDDLRESPVITLLETLIGKGREVRVFDPQLDLRQIYGANQKFVLNAIPHIGKLLDSSLDDLLDWADHLVLTQKPDAAAAERIRAAGIRVLNLAAGQTGLSMPSSVASESQVLS